MWNLAGSVNGSLKYFDLQVSMVSVVYSQSELLQKEVFLVELIESTSMSREPMSHLKAIYFLRPTSENIQHLRRQLASPRFGEYHICTSLVLAINIDLQHYLLEYLSSIKTLA